MALFRAYLLTISKTLVDKRAGILSTIEKQPQRKFDYWKSEVCLLLLTLLPCCNNICGVNWSFPSKKLLQKVDLSIWLLDRQARTPICNEKNVKMKLTDTKRNEGRSFLTNTFTCILLCFWWFSVGICRYKQGYKSHDQL